MKQIFTLRKLVLFLFSWGFFLNYGYAQTAIPTGSFTATCFTTGNVNWDNSVLTGGNMELVFVKAGSAITVGVPSSNISTYTANVNVTSGTAYQNDAAAFCVYKGIGATVSLTNMVAGTPYYFLIFNTNGTTTYSTGLTFNSTLNYVPSDATGLSAATGTAQSVVSWTNPNALLSCFDDVLIVASNTTITGPPTGDGTAYTANPTLGAGTGLGGGNVVYKGSTSPLTVLGLTNGNTYYFKVWVRKTTTWSAGVQTTVTLPASPSPVHGPSSFVASCIDAGTASWTNPGTVYNIVVFAKAGSAVTAGPLTKDVTTFYTANTAFGSGTAFENDASAFCVYNGTGTSVNITGLSPGVTYNFLVFNANTNNYSTSYTITPAATPAAPANVNTLVTTPSSGQIILGWSNTPLGTCFDEVMVVARESSAVTATVSGDGSAYTANPAFASGTQIILGQFVVYKGTGNTVTVTNLTNCTSAYFEIFTRKGTTWSSGVGTNDLPTAPLTATLTPLNNATNVATNTTLTLTFSSPPTISATGGSAAETSITITENGGPFQTIARGSGNIVIAGSVATVTINALNLGKLYDVVVGDKVFSGCGSDFAGITTTNWDFHSSPGVTITAPTAGVCQNVYTALGDIVLTETAVNNFQGSPSTGMSMVLRFDVTGFAFLSGTAGVTVQVAGGGDISTATPASISFSGATFTINFPVGNAQNQPDMITIKGLQITSDGSNPTGHIVMDASSTLAVQGITTGTTVLGTVNTGATPAAPTLSGFSSGTGSYCQGTNINAITVTVTGSGIKWFSDIGLTNVVFSGNPANIKSDLGISSGTPGTTTFYAAQTSTCLSPGLAVPVTIFPSPGASAGSFGSTQCSGNLITLGGSPTVSTPSTPPYAYAWTETTGNYTGGPISAISNPQVTITNASGSTLNYNFKVTITDNNSCTASNANNFNVYNQAIPSLTQPGSTFLTTKTPPQTLSSNFTTTSFTGIGVVQTSASVYKFIASQAYDSLQALPQTFPIYFNGTDPNGCTITHYNIATITLSNNTFTYLQNQYCSAEFPYGGALPAGGVDLSLSGPTTTNVASYVSSWDITERFYYEDYSIPAWAGTVVSYNQYDLVYYGGEIYRAGSNIAASIFNLPPTSGGWTVGAFKVQYNGMIRNYYEGYYGGNNGQPTINKNGLTYYMYTNPNYNGCPTCNYEYPAAYVEFSYFRDIRYYIGNYQTYYDYYPGEIVVNGGNIYICTAYNAAGTAPPPNASYWNDVTSTGFDVGYMFYDPANSKSGYYTYGQFVQININPTVSFTGLNNGQNICEADINNNALTFDLTSNLQTGGVTNAGTFEISFDGGTTWVKDVASSNAISNIGINSGRATFNSLNAWTQISTAVSGGSYSWVSTNTYSTGDNVFYLAKFYRSKINNNTNNAPDVSPADWEVNALKVDVRLYYDPGTTGSTPGSPGSVGDVCDGVSAIKVYLDQSPTVAFSPAITLQTFCNNAAAVNLNTNRNSGVVLSGFGVTSNATSNGTGTFTPPTAFSQSVSAGGTSTSPQEIILTATYTDNHGCQNFTQSITGSTFVVNPPPPASYTVTTSSQTYNITTVSPAVIIPFCFNDAAATVTGPQGLAWFDVVYQGVSSPYTKSYGSIGHPGNTFSFLASAFFADAASKGANPLNTISFQINYTSYDLNNCITQIQSVSFSVAPSLQVSITGVLNQAVFCSNEGSVTLKFSPFQSTGTSFSINGTPSPIGSPAGSDTYIYPLSTNLGQVIFSYNIQSGNGNACNNPAADTIHVLKSPVASFHINPKCDSAVVPFNASDISGNPGPAHYTWTFTDNPPVTSIAQNTTYAWNAVGNYNVHLDVRYDPDPTYGKVCVANNVGLNDAGIDHLQVIGPIPTVDFNYSNVCSGDTTNFAASQTNGVTQYSWDFGDGTVTSFGNSVASLVATNTYGTYQFPLHQFGPATYQVMVTGRTDSTAGACPNSTSRQVSILKKLTVDSTNFYNMQTANPVQSDGYWVVEDRGGNTTWNFSSVTPGGAIPAQPAWNNIFYNSSDQSYVNSPCLNMLGYTKPAIALQYFMDGRPQQDGAVLQYSTDIIAGVQQWVDVGNIGSGQDWYTTQGISGKPGDPFNPTFYGWSEAGDAQWNDSKNALDVITTLSVAKRKKVRFRIAFGSDLGSTNGARGFAFNNVTIVNRNRLSLIENFTNDNLSSAVTNNTDFQTFQAGNNEVVKLEYHVGIPSPDAINSQDSADPNARGAFYGLTNSSSLIPRAYLDGTSQGDFTTGWLNNAYTLRSLKASPMTIKIKTDTFRVGTALITKVSAAAAATQNITTGNLRFYLMTIEKVVGSDQFVVRKIYPDAAGSAVSVPFNVGSPDSLKINPWTIGSQEIGNISQIALVAFVQDIDTKEVLQAAYLPNPLLPAVITGIEPVIADEISTYPIPSDREFFVELPQPAQQAIEIRMVNQLGQPASIGSFAEGEQRKAINTEQLADGVYILQLGNSGSIARKKVMVIHNR